jgi:hypothetical protein
MEFSMYNLLPFLFDTVVILLSTVNTDICTVSEWLNIPAQATEMMIQDLVESKVNSEI